MAKDEARRQVDAANRKLSEATKARSAAAMASLYTENATFIAADGTVVSGRSAIETMWKGRIEAGLKGLELETITLEDLGLRFLRRGRPLPIRGRGERGPRPLHGDLEAEREGRGRDRRRRAGAESGGVAVFTANAAKSPG